MGLRNIWNWRLFGRCAASGTKGTFGKPRKSSSSESLLRCLFGRWTTSGTKGTFGNPWKSSSESLLRLFLDGTAPLATIIFDCRRGLCTIFSWFRWAVSLWPLSDMFSAAHYSLTHPAAYSHLQVPLLPVSLTQRSRTVLSALDVDKLLPVHTRWSLLRSVKVERRASHEYSPSSLRFLSSTATDVQLLPASVSPPMWVLLACLNNRTDCLTLSFRVLTLTSWITPWIRQFSSHVDCLEMRDDCVSSEPWGTIGNDPEYWSPPKLTLETFRLSFFYVNPFHFLVATLM